MGFQIGLIHNQQAIFITKVIEVSIVGIMCRSDCIKVKLLYLLQLLPDVVTCHSLPPNMVMIVPVDTIEVSKFTIDQKFTVVLRKRNASKTYPATLNLKYMTRTVLQSQSQRVQIGILIAPFSGILNLCLQQTELNIIKSGIRLIKNIFHSHLQGSIQYSSLLPVVQLCTQHIAGNFSSGKIIDPRSQAKNRILIGLVQFGLIVKISDPKFGFRQQQNLSLYATHTPMILIFQIRATAPAKHLNRHDVLTCLQIRRNIKL